MMVVSNILHRKRSALTILGVSTALGIAYPLVADKPGDWVAELNGLLIGFFGGVAIILFELHVFFLPRKIYSFSAILIVKIVTYTITFISLIVTIVSFTRGMQSGVSLLAYMQSDAFHHFIFEEDFNAIVAYTFAAVFIVIINRQVSRKMGSGELFNYVIGRYHKPKREHRIFLAIDLRSSTPIAEKLGDLMYHEFLKRYFYDLTFSIASHEGQIYRYVGDQVTITWLLPSGLRRDNAVNCFFSAQKFLHEQQAFYLNKFGVAPTFRGALDMGEVLTAEVGLDKQQLVFYGDVMQRLPDIEKACKHENQDLLISEYVAVLLRQSREFEFIECARLTEGSHNVPLFMAKSRK